MDNFEVNKIAMAVLVAGVTAMSISLVVNSFYAGAGKHDAHKVEAKRGYQIEVTEEVTDGGGDAPAKPVDIANFFATASMDKGVQLTKACAACHSFDAGGANKVGPNLYGIVGKKTASTSNYSYSNALAARGAEGKIWDYQSLSEFLEKPRNYVAGTKMAYAGMKKPEDRASTLLYLRSLNASPLPLPEVKAVEVKAEAPKAEAPKADATKIETPKIEIPEKVEAPKIETPKIDAKPTKP